ncbi:MAG TPA: amino acid ABC transporter ATP-binding protein [Polyangiaceae bacterium]|nr:amino acid ABC transporter ATP-binding protein [Polyangiaceae bacterium]
MIQIHGLRKAYGAHVVLAGIEARVPAGAVVALAGPSGSGKSTLLRCLNGLEPFDAGSIEIAGHRLSPGAPGAPLARLRGDVGMVFQDYQLFPHLSALENVTLAPRVVQKLSAREAERLGQSWLERVGLADRTRHYPSQLSGGQRQRVALARALAQGAKALLLDEPTSALDPDLRGEIRSTLAQLVRERQGSEPLTIVISTHDLDLAHELASEMWVLESGTLEARARSRASGRCQGDEPAARSAAGT